jgi:hypothetical protein
MLFGQASSSGDTLAVIAALTVMFGGVLLVATVIWGQARRLADPRRSGEAQTHDSSPFKWPGPLNQVKFAGRRYSLTPADHQVTEWLNDLIQWWHLSRVQSDSPIRLVRFRGEFRGIIASTPVGGLVSCLSDPDKESRKLAIWLLGRCARRRAIVAVATLKCDPDPVVRRHVAKALKRMSAWSELYRMATRDDDSHVRCAANSFSVATRRPHSDRLRQFVQHGGGAMFEPGRYTSHMPVFMLQPVGPGKPAKSRDWIRRILQHIRELVRSPFKNRAA